MQHVRGQSALCCQINVCMYCRCHVLGSVVSGLLILIVSSSSSAENAPEARTMSNKTVSYTNKSRVKHSLRSKGMSIHSEGHKSFWPLRLHPSGLGRRRTSCVTRPNFVALGQTVWAQVGGPKLLVHAAWAPPTWARHAADLLKICFSPTLPNSVVLCQTV